MGRCVGARKLPRWPARRVAPAARHVCRRCPPPATNGLRALPPLTFGGSLACIGRSDANSWSRRFGEIPTLEMLQTLAANAAAPFILCSQLMGVLAPRTAAEPYGHVVN
eukprot:6958639-Prymnesium_polylepis.1